MKRYVAFLRGMNLGGRRIKNEQPAALEASKGKLQIAFLLTSPKAGERKQALALSIDDDRLAIDGRQLYWLPKGGLSESHLDLNAIAAALGPITIRTKGTVEQIVAKYFGR